MPISYKCRLPGGTMRVVTYDKHNKKTVEYLPPKKKKGKKK